MTSHLSRALNLLFMAAVAHGEPPFQDNFWEERLQEPGDFGPAARIEHTAVWTGTEMIIWSGRSFWDSDSLNDGHRYNPRTNTWKEVTTVGAPTARRGHTAVWTGREMIVWGGGSTTGGRYDPATNAWRPTTTLGAPDNPSGLAVWAGSEMIILGGNSGGRYDPISDSWTPLNLDGAPIDRFGSSAVWTGTEMIVWGGGGYVGDVIALLRTGAQYNPATNTWTPLTATGAPTARYAHTAIWTGTEMIIWGGRRTATSGFLNDGGRYNPATGAWKVVTSGGAPPPRSSHAALWTGREMIVWGGYFYDFTIGTQSLASGALYKPLENSWVQMPAQPVWHPGDQATAVWTGREMIVWGGTSFDGSTVRFYPNPMLYFPPPLDSAGFRITGVVRGDGNLTLTFPTVTNCTYTLWRSDTLRSDTWMDTGLPAVAGTGATLSFTVPATTPATRFFRVQAAP